MCWNRWNDRIGANGLKHNILGLGGNDRIVAGSGDDGVCGGPGNDRISGDDGKDEIFGDVIDDPGIPVTCGEGYGSDIISGGPGNDRLYHGLGTPDDLKQFFLMVIKTSLNVAQARTPFG